MSTDKLNKSLKEVIKPWKKGMTNDQKKWFDKYSTTKPFLEKLEKAVRDMDLDKMKKGGLVGKQKKLDKNKDGKITKADFKMMKRKKK